MRRGARPLLAIPPLGLLAILLVLFFSATVSITPSIGLVMSLDPGLALFLLAIGAFALPLSLKRRKTVYMEEGYDNADVSYAPYVLMK